MLNKKISPVAIQERKMTRDEYITIVNKIHNNYYDYSKVIFVDLYTKIIITCPRHGDFVQTPAYHYHNKQGCTKCGILRRVEAKRITLEMFIKRAKAIHGDHYDYTKTILGRSLKQKIKLTCKIHGDFYIVADKHIHGAQGCRRCGYSRFFATITSTRDAFIAKANEVHNYAYWYTKVDYVNNKVPVIITCKIHGDFKARPDNHIGGKTGCPICSESKGELILRNFFADNDIKYVREFRFENSKFRFDFYLPELNILIEYDGRYHFAPVDWIGGQATYEGIVKRDKLKTELASAHNIPLIRLPYTKYHTLIDYLLFMLSRYFKYKVDNKFYRDFLSLCRGLKLPSATKIKDVKHHLTYSKQ